MSGSTGSISSLTLTQLVPVRTSNGQQLRTATGTNTFGKKVRDSYQDLDMFMLGGVIFF